MNTYKPSQVEGLALIRNGCAMIQEGINRLIESEEHETKPQYDLEKITWTQETGNRGRYEKAVEQDSIDFRALLNDLEEHSGKLQRNGFFIWKFSTGSNIGRKLIQKR